MEKNSSSEQHVGHGSSHSWWLDNHNRPQYQSLWLQSTLSEFGAKIQTMLTLIQDDGDTFAKRAEMFYQKRPELINLLEDLHRSFCALADKYDQLNNKSESIRACSSSNSLSHYFPSSCCPPQGNQEITLLEAPEDHSHPHLDSESDKYSNFNFQLQALLNGTPKEEHPSVVPIDDQYPSQTLENGDETTDDHHDPDQGPGIINGKNYEYEDDSRKTSGSLERAKVCTEVITLDNMSKLFEDNFQRQAELVTKVAATVEELCAHIDKLANEKRALKNYCAQSKVEIKRSRSHISRLKESILKKLLR